MHHMALGETIGYSTRTSQNAIASFGYYPNLYYNANAQLFAYSFFDRMVHISLLGDPTLRADMRPVANVATVTASKTFPNKVQLNWAPPTGDVDAYIVLRRRGTNPLFVLQTPTPITSTSFEDSTRFEGDMEYKVQAVALRSSASGTFYDYGKPASTTVTTTSVAELAENAVAPVTLSAAPNPAQSDAAFTVHIDASQGLVQSLALAIHDMLGRTVWSFEQSNVLPGTFNIGFNVSTLVEGRYIVRLTTDGTSTTTPLTVAR